MYVLSKFECLQCATLTAFLVIIERPGKQFLFIVWQKQLFQLGFWYFVNFATVFISTFLLTFC